MSFPRRPKAFQALGRLKQGQMNKTEAAYEAHLKAQQAAGVILWYAFEPIKLRLAPSTYYTPDFIVLKADGALEAHEIKGYWQEDARVKIKVAAEKFPFAFKAYKPRPKSQGGGRIEEFFGGEE